MFLNGKSGAGWPFSGGEIPAEAELGEALCLSTGQQEQICIVSAGIFAKMGA